MSESMDYREVDTPWQPEPIIWRDGRDLAHREALKAFTRLPEPTHVVREVRVVDVGKYGTPHLTLTQIEDTIDRTETEFMRMISVGLNVAPHEWHVTQDMAGKHRTLARVAIIDGFKLSKHQTIHGIKSLPEPRRSIELAYEDMMERYYAQADEYELFDGHSKQQYIYGSPRGTTEPQSLNLVDIEPVFYTVDRNKL